MSCCGRICVEAAQIRARSEPPLRTLSGHFGPFGKDAERKQQVTRRYGSGLVFQASQSSNDRSVSLGTWLRANFSNTIGRNRRVLSHQSRAQSGLFRWPRRSSRHMRLWTCPDRRREQLPAKDEGPQVHSRCFLDMPTARSLDHDPSTIY